MQKNLGIAVGITMLVAAGYVVKTSILTGPISGDILNAFPSSTGMMPSTPPDTEPVPVDMNPMNTGMNEGGGQTSVVDPNQMNTNTSQPSGGTAASPTDTASCADQYSFSQQQFSVTGPSSQDVLTLASQKCKNSVVSPPPCPGPLNICSQQGYVATDFIPSYEPKYLGITAQSGVPQYKVEGYCWYTRHCGSTSPNGTPVPGPSSTPSIQKPKYCCSDTRPSSCVSYTTFQPTCSGQLSGNIFIGDSTCRNRCGELQ